MISFRATFPGNSDLYQFLQEGIRGPQQETQIKIMSSLTNFFANKTFTNFEIEIAVKLILFKETKGGIKDKKISRTKEEYLFDLVMDSALKKEYSMPISANIFISPAAFEKYQH